MRFLTRVTNDEDPILPTSTSPKKWLDSGIEARRTLGLFQNRGAKGGDVAKPSRKTASTGAKLLWVTSHAQPWQNQSPASTMTQCMPRVPLDMAA